MFHVNADAIDQVKRIGDDADEDVDDPDEQ